MLINTKTLEEIRNTMLAKWIELIPTANTNSDSMIFIDSSVMAEVIYQYYQDVITMTNNAFLAYATGDELSNLGADRGVLRKRASPSSGIVSFQRETLSDSDYIIPVGTIIGTQPSNDGTSVTFKTIEEKTLYGTVADPSIAPGYSINNTGGTIGNGTYNFRFSAISVDGKETLPSPITSVVVSGGGTTKSIQLSWTSIPKAASYIIYLNGIKLGVSTVPNYLAITGSTGAETKSPVSTNETGNISVNVQVESITLGTISNSGIGLVTNLIQKPVGIDSVINNNALSGGTDEESDSDYRDRIKLFLGSNTGKTTANGYEKTALSIEGVDTAYAVHNPADPINRIRVYITGTGTTRIPSPSLISEVQSILDSDANRAVCDEIQVLSPSVTTINLSINIDEYATTITQSELEVNISANIQSYINSVEIDGIIRLVDIENVIHDTTGVIDFSVSSPTANITLSGYSIAALGTITFNY